MASSISSPPTRTEALHTVPFKAITAISEVPPPISTIMLPTGSSTGMPIPMAAAIGSCTRWTSLAPACFAASITARFSTSVIPLGTPTTTRGFTIHSGYFCTRLIKVCKRVSTSSKSAITPSRMGRTARLSPGVRPSIFFASKPMAVTRLFLLSTAITVGSLMTIPWPPTWTSVFAVPRSIPISQEKSPNKIQSSFKI